jgi:hypothetical protein
MKKIPALYLRTMLRAIREKVRPHSSGLAADVRRMCDRALEDSDRAPFIDVDGVHLTVRGARQLIQESAARARRVGILELEASEAFRLLWEAVHASDWEGEDPVWITKALRLFQKRQAEKVAAETFQTSGPKDEKGDAICEDHQRDLEAD